MPSYFLNRLRAFIGIAHVRVFPDGKYRVCCRHFFKMYAWDSDYTAWLAIMSGYSTPGATFDTMEEAWNSFLGHKGCGYRGRIPK